VAAAGILGLKVAVVSFFLFSFRFLLCCCFGPLSPFFFSSFFLLCSPLFFFSAAFDSFSLHSSFLSKITCGFLPFVLPFLSQKKIISLSVSVFLPTLSLSLFFFFFFGPPPLFSAVFSSSKNFCPPTLFVSLPLFISRKRGSSPLLCPIVVQGGAGLPYLCRVRWPAFAGHGAPFLAGYGFIGMGFVQVGGEREWEK